MENKDIIMVFAVILGPVLAVQAQRIIDNMREKRRRKLNVFYTLMSTRAARVSGDHVKALNMIDLEFYGRKFLSTRFQSQKNKAVTNAWKNYNDHLSDKAFRERNKDGWEESCNTLFTSLIYAMSHALGYDFDEVQLKRDCYRPIAHDELEYKQLAILAGAEEVLSGKRSIPMAVTYFPNMQPNVDNQVENSETNPTP